VLIKLRRPSCSERNRHHSKATINNYILLRKKNKPALSQLASPI